MMSKFRATLALVTITIFVWFLSNQSSTHAAQSDIECLNATKNSLRDPFNYLSSWVFTNGTQSSICDFTGIECWHEDDNKVLNIKLAGMGLEGEFPLGVTNCLSMMGLDLSNNNFTGHIPNISHLIGFITTLDLSSNRFYGEIPVDLANCTFLNVLNLEKNNFAGQIPPLIGQLTRLKQFSVANNQLSGPVPAFVNNTNNTTTKFEASSYANNAGLCGESLPRCISHQVKKNRTPMIIGAAIGCPLGFAIGLLCYLRRQSEMKTKKKKKQQQLEEENDPLCNKWAKSIEGAKRIKLSVFKKSVPRTSLHDLMKATNDFSKENVIGTGRTGTMYTAVLKNGTSLMVRRVGETQHSEKKFISEMSVLRNVKHRYLVPLVGFCSAKNERFLVYEHMPNGRRKEGDEIMDWPLRLNIAIRAAKGLAWLHRMSWNPRTFHWNTSSKCILLDANYEPKLYDFVPASLVRNPIDHNHICTVVIEDAFSDDLGYVAPEYARTLVATPKGDVYSFGVVLLELVTREKPTLHVAKARGQSFEGSLVKWVSQLSRESRAGDAIDGFLVGKGFDSEIFKFLKVACDCVLAGHKERPTMFEVYRVLRAIGRRYEIEDGEIELGGI